MKRALLNKWIEELESGRWPQGRGTLHNLRGGTYCCLGVLCEIAGLEKTELSESVRYYYKDTFESTYLPAAFAGEQKVHNDAGLGLLNDAPVPFKEIAAELKANAERYVEVEDD